jgi:hypothetical protein
MIRIILSATSCLARRASAKLAHARALGSVFWGRYWESARTLTLGFSRKIQNTSRLSLESETTNFNFYKSTFSKHLKKTLFFFEMSKRNISQISDEGYNSDRSDRTENTTEKIRVLSRENRIFKEKYFVEKVINNSANGIIYKGKMI